MALTFSLYCTASLFVLPFLKLYTAGITDVHYVDPLLPYLFVATYLLSNGRSAAQRVIEYAGHFKLTQNRSIVESIINIVVSLICVVRFGIYGVLCGTIAALLYRTNDMILYASRKLLNRSPMETYLKWGTNFALYGLFVMIFTKVLAEVEFTNYFTIIIGAAAVCILSVFAFFLVGSVMDRESFLFCLEFVKAHVRKRNHA